MIAPNPKHWAYKHELPACSSASGSKSCGNASQATDGAAQPSVIAQQVAVQQHARRAAASLLFDGSQPVTAGAERRPSPWAIIVVWLLSVWMLIAVACHYSWMLHSLVHK